MVERDRSTAATGEDALKIRTVLHEPLLHFLLIGLGLFLLYGAVSPGDSDGKRITVSQARVDDMAAQFKALWGRPPSPDELRGLVDGFVRDEIIFREGLALGLDKDDAVIKRRVRQKYELLAEEPNAGNAPTDADLAAWLKAHPQAFTRPAVVTFDQIYFDPAATTPAHIAEALKAAQHGAAATSLGQATLLPTHVDAMALDLVARDFGTVFADRVAAAPIGQWIGPFDGAIGVHLLRVTRRTAPQLPPLDDVRMQVAREWENDRRVRARDAALAALKKDYSIDIEARLPGAVP